LYQNEGLSSTMTVHPLHFGDEGQRATRELLRRFDEAASEASAGLRAPLATLESIDRQYGGAGALPLEGADELVASLLVPLESLGDDELILGVALWALRHEVPLTVVEPVVNALARRSNAARTREELAAVFGLMQAVIANVAPRLAADLERSNPERPWRLLHANLAITAIRTEDPAMMDFAFDALDRALPDERAGFYAEALALALAPRVAPAVRERLEARQARWAGQ
jgi:hypothetical protein